MPRLPRLLITMARGTAGVVVVALLVVMGKAGQYAAVAQFAPRLGFDAASLVGLLPTLALMVAVRILWRRRHA